MLRVARKRVERKLTAESKRRFVDGGPTLAPKVDKREADEVPAIGIIDLKRVWL